MDPAWDAAIQRAGLLRVQDTHELFSAVKPSATCARCAVKTDDRQQRCGAGGAGAG